MTPRPTYDMLSLRDHSLLIALCRCIRFASLEQLANSYWVTCRDPRRSAVARLHALKRNGLIRSSRVCTIQLPELNAPLASWRPGEWGPDFGELAWKLTRRWKQRPQMCQVFYATPRAANWLGGSRTGTIPRPFHVAHDLGVAAMFFAVWKSIPDLPHQWIDEEMLAPMRKGEKLPDALLGTDINRPICVLEFGGQYGKNRLQSFHDDCEERGLPCQIW